MRAVPPSGTLQEAIDTRTFHTNKGLLEGTCPSMPAVLRMAEHVASGMAYLHGQGILHGDLCPRNVMLRRESGSSTDPINLVGKVGNFGPQTCV